MIYIDDDYDCYYRKHLKVSKYFWGKIGFDWIRIKLKDEVKYLERRK